MVGMSIQVLAPGEPNGMYHWETEQEDFIVLAGEVLLIVERQERRLRAWDFVHCPPQTRHVFVAPATGLASSPPPHHGNTRRRSPGATTQTAARYGAAPEIETQDPAVAYAGVAPSERTRYRDGVLPG
jgi:hypothetical protein